MAFSVEPGIYPGPHGARIEDIVVCTDDGGERLNHVTRELDRGGRLMPAPPGLRSSRPRALLDLTREIADAELRPAADAAEKSGTFPRQAFRMLGKAGLLGLPYPERLGGGGQPYEVYLQVIEELAACLADGRARA